MGAPNYLEIPLLLVTLGKNVLMVLSVVRKSIISEFYDNIEEPQLG